MIRPFFAVNLSGVGDYWGVILTDFLILILHIQSMKWGESLYVLSPSTSALSPLTLVPKTRYQPSAESRSINLITPTK